MLIVLLCKEDYERMNIKSIEPTPSPNSMKIILDQTLPEGERNNYTKENIEDAPSIIQQLLSIEGVKGIFQVADFLAIERNPRTDWKKILHDVRRAFGEEKEDGPIEDPEKSTNESFGEVKVLVQFFKDIPMQVKLLAGEEEKRFGLPDHFKNAAVSAVTTENIVMERKWVEQGVRYGTLDEVGQQVVEELLAAYDEKRLQGLLNEALHPTEAKKQHKKRNIVTLEMLDELDWKSRYAALEQMDPTIEDLPVLQKALADEKASIRRLAVVYLGMIESEKVLPLLYEAVLNDPSVTVRRTAGDCLSDIGNPQAIPTMVKALKDKNKLVRWRAAMFLYEVGDKSAVEALHEAENDSEFEVSMQVKLALNRIEGGKAAEGSVWKQMTERFNK